jgi:PIN domain nuclease of toxin-antitoxin system
VVLIDTHIWIWWLAGLPQLPAKYRRALNGLATPPLLSVISLWEASMLIARSRISVSPTPAQWLAEATRPDAVQLVQLNASIAEELLMLPRTLPRDPADQIIAASARALHVPVLTMDRRLLASGAIKLWL